MHPNVITGSDTTEAAFLDESQAAERERLREITDAFQEAFRAGDLRVAWQRGSELLGLNNLKLTHGHDNNSHVAIDPFVDRNPIFGSQNQDPINTWLAMDDSAEPAERVRVMQTALWHGLGVFRWHYDSSEKGGAVGVVAIAPDFKPRIIRYMNADLENEGYSVDNAMGWRGYLRGNNIEPPLALWCRNNQDVGGAAILDMLTAEPHNLLAEWRVGTIEDKRTAGFSEDDIATGPISLVTGKMAMLGGSDALQLFDAR